MAKNSTSFKKGHRQIEESRLKMRLAKLGSIGNKKGKKCSVETIEKIKMARKKQVMPKGEFHYNWKGGITALRKKLYFSEQYKLWRISVFKRDGYVCQNCGLRGGELNADHIKPWAFFPDLRFEISNGRTLCVDCHRKTDTWGRRDYQKVGQNL